MAFALGGVKFKLQFWFFIVIGLFAYLDRTNSVTLVLAAVIIHELGHLAAMWIFKTDVKELELGPFGARITLGKAYTGSYLNEMLIYLAGPLSGLVVASVIINLSGGQFLRFALINIGLSAFNLLPISTLDGGSFLFAVLCGAMGPVRAKAYLDIITYLLLIPLFILSFILLFRGAENMSLLITCTYLSLTALLR